MVVLMLRIFWIFINLNEKAGYKIILRLVRQVFVASLCLVNHWPVWLQGL